VLIIRIPQSITIWFANKVSEALPKHEFSMGFIAQKGAGKTTTLMNILHFYKQYFHTIIIFSPTIDNDEKWEWVS